LERRLAELGFTAGARVKVLHSTGPGPVLVLVRGSRVALGRGLAMRILVEPAEGV
jgi:ferrous iron transport protein A